MTQILREMDIGLEYQITLKLQHDSHRPCNGSNPAATFLLDSQEICGSALPAPCNVGASTHSITETCSSQLLNNLKPPRTLLCNIVKHSISIN